MKHILYIFALMFMSVYGFAAETLQEKIKNILNDKTIEPVQQYMAAFDTIADHFLDLSFEEALLIHEDILLPFVEKNLKDERQYNIAKADIYREISVAYELRGEPEDLIESEYYLKKAVEYADLSGDAAARARYYHHYAYWQSTRGSVQLAHEYYYKAINLYESIEKYDSVFDCLFLIAENQLQTRDITGLRKVIEQMLQYIKTQPTIITPNCLYYMYSVQSAYYCVLAEDNPEITAYNDSTLMATRNTINVIENHFDELITNAAPAFAYHNMSLAYRRCFPDRYDSIYYFLDKAFEINDGDRFSTLELEICVYISYAELHFEQKRYEQAEKDMLYVLSLLEQIKDNNSIMPEYTEAYKFLVMYYETMNRPSEALKYHKLLLENDRKRYDNEKIVAMNDMLVKYEVEKKKEEIDRLTERTQTARKILFLTITLITVLLVVLLILIRLYQLRKKNYDQSIYESALLAELKQNELDDELKRIKQQLEQKPTKTIIKKLTEWISTSPMEKTKRDTYIQQLSELDIEMLERGYLTADEKMSNMDMKYIICFAIDMDVKDMSLLFNVEPASIRTVRYRIKKKFGDKNTFTFLM